MSQSQLVCCVAILTRPSSLLCPCSPTQKRMQHVSNISILVMYTMYFLAALFGYLTFYGETFNPLNLFLPGLCLHVRRTVISCRRA